MVEGGQRIWRTGQRRRMPARHAACSRPLSRPPCPPSSGQRCQPALYADLTSSTLCRVLRRGRASTSPSSEPAPCRLPASQLIGPRALARYFPPTRPCPDGGRRQLSDALWPEPAQHRQHAPADDGSLTAILLPAGLDHFGSCALCSGPAPPKLQEATWPWSRHPQRLHRMPQKKGKGSPGSSLLASPS